VKDSHPAPASPAASSSSRSSNSSSGGGGNNGGSLASVDDISTEWSRAVATTLART